MKTFPFDKIVFDSAKLSGEDQNVSLEIVIKPFELSVDDYSENVNTCMEFNGIKIPNEPLLLQGKEFTFPLNPVEGYIEGWIYFFSTYNPVDVTKLKFGDIENGKLTVEIESCWVLEHENTGFTNFTIMFGVEIDTFGVEVEL